MTAEEQALVDELRDLLGEAVPEPNSPETLFSDAKLLGFIKSSSSMNHAALRGWQIKQAHFANLVNVTDGAASREMGELFEHAASMVKYWGNQAKSATYGRSRVGRILRG